MKTKKLLAVMSLVAVSALAGCTNGDGDGDGTGGGDGDIELLFKSTFSYEDQINSLITAFQELNPGIKVTYEKYSGNYDALKTNVIDGIGAGNIPDIVSCYPDHIAEYLDQGIVVNIENYIKDAFTQEELDDMLYMDQCSNFLYTGTYMLPHSPSTEAMFYNEDILGKVYTYIDDNSQEQQVNNGQPITKEYLNSITWEELLNKLAPALLKYNSEHDNCFLDVTKADKAYVVNYSGSDNAFVTLCEEKGVTFSSLDKENGNGVLNFNDTDVMRNTLKDLNAYYRKGIFSTAGICGETNVNVNQKKYAIFATGSTGGIKYQVPSDSSFGTGVMRIPNFEGKAHKVISQGPGICVLKSNDAKREAAAFKFIKFLTEYESTLYWSLETGYFPVRQSCYASDDYLNAASETGKTAKSLELLKAKTYAYASNITGDYFTNPPFKGSSQARTLCGSLLNTVVGSKTELTDESVAASFAETINAIKKKM